ncbi:SA1362 family protein [Peribacillus saganii]|uniref:SA1362 family protein n=1 Tax=Peribacillus saganii TaxID=2303992 RepID=UPI00115CD65B|nr:SA1362 family protein [Peribacillus saganii]
MNRSFSYIVYGIIALGAIGLISRMFTDPVGFFRNLLIIAITAGIVYVLYKRLTKDKPNKKEQRSFSKAAKQSVQRQKGRESASKGKHDNVASFSLAKTSRKIRNRKKSEAQLTVIEGKKGKKKNRALF